MSPETHASISTKATARSQGRTTLVTFLVLLVGMLYLNFEMMRTYFLPVVMGAFLATITHPFYRKLRSHKVGPKTSAAIVTLVIVLIIVGPLTGFVQMGVSQAATFIKSISEEQSSFSPKAIIQKVSQWQLVQRVMPDPATIEKQLTASLQSVGKAIPTAALGAASSLPEVILQLALAAFACFFFLIDGRKLIAWVLERVPLDRDVQQTLLRSLKDTTVSSILATLAAAAVQAVLMLVGFLVLGVPLAVFACGATFIFAWIPILGSTPVWIGATIYLFTQDSPGRAVAMLILGAITGVSDNFVRPLVLRGRGDMHPLLGLVAIFGGIEMFGIMGVFVGPVVVALLVALLNVWPTVGRRFGLLSTTSGSTIVTKP